MLGLAAGGRVRAWTGSQRGKAIQNCHCVSPVVAMCVEASSLLLR